MPRSLHYAEPVLPAGAAGPLTDLSRPAPTNFVYPLTLTPDPDGGFLVTFLDWPEATTQGETRDGAIEGAADCLEEAVAARVDDRAEIPLPSSPRSGEAAVAVSISPRTHQPLRSVRPLVTCGQNCPILRCMTGSEFIHRVQRYAKAHGLVCRVDHKRGKGSHVTLYPGGDPHHRAQSKGRAEDRNPPCDAQAAWPAADRSIEMPR